MIHGLVLTISLLGHLPVHDNDLALSAVPDMGFPSSYRTAPNAYQTQTPILVLHGFPTNIDLAMLIAPGDVVTT